MKRLLILFIAGLLLISAASRYMAGRPAPATVAEVRTRPATSPKIERLPPVILDSSANTPKNNPLRKKSPTNSVITANEPAPVTTTAQAQTPSPKGTKPSIQDPVARLALTDVGLDPDADEYWLMAINDPTLSANERQDLIEDLNEEGFDDPKNLTIDDLPLIISRIALIEEYAPLAMDEVNAAAFDEAYKDLLDMFDKVTRP